MSNRTPGLSRFQWILAGALLVQVILAVVVNLPRTARTESSLLVADFDPAQVVDLLIENQAGMQLHMTEVNGQWELPEAGNYPVNSQKVSEVLGKIQNITTDRLVTQTAASHQQLQVSENNFLGRLTLTGSDGKPRILYVGSAAGSGATHVRLDGMDQVYLTGELASWEVSPTVSSWIDTAYVNLDTGQLQAVSVENARGTFNFIKNENGAWSLDDLAEGEVLDSTALETTLNRFNTLRMAAPLGTQADASWGLDQPQATAVFESADGTELSITIGAVLEDGNYAAKASNSPYYVSIPAITADSLINMDRTDLLVQPTPTPTAVP